MNVRFTFQALTERTLAATRRQANALPETQMEAATGKKFQQISDNPTDALAALSGNHRIQRLDAHRSTIAIAQSTLNDQVSTLQNASSLLASVRSLALEAANSTNDTASFSSMADQVDRYLSQFTELANSQHNGSYLFAGTASHTQPFEVVATNADGTPTQIRYNGSAENQTAHVSTSWAVPGYLNGLDVFGPGKRDVTKFTGSTGAKPGVGIDNATGSGSLLVQHTATTFAAGSGIQTGTSSATGDNILGPAGAHRIVVTDTSGTGAAGTVSLDGGPPIAFTNADNNLKVIGPAGQIMYVNTTAITPGFTGSIDITANGTLSVDGGLTTTPINFSTNQQLTDSRTGKVTNVDTTAITAAGSEGLEYTGTMDIFQTLIALRDDLRNTKGLPEKQQLEAISARVGDLDRIHDKLLQATGSQSASLATLQDLDSHFQSLKLNEQQRVSDLEDADLSDLVVRQQANQNMLQLTLTSFAQILSTSLMDYLK